MVTSFSCIRRYASPEHHDSPSLLEPGSGLPRGVQGAADPHFAKRHQVVHPALSRPSVRWRGAVGVHRRQARGRRLDGMVRSQGRSAVVRGHRSDGVLCDQSGGVDRHPPAGRQGAARLRRARRRLLAGVRRERQVRHHDPRRVASPQRAVAPERCQQGRVDGSPRHGGTAGRGAGRSPAGRARLSRAHLRLAAVRAGEGGDRQGHARAVSAPSSPAR